MKYLISLFIIFLLTVTMVNAQTRVQWLGQSAFLITSQNGKKILIDPYLTQNPKTPKKLKKLKHYQDVDLILISHGHFDHLGDYQKLLKLNKKMKISMNPDMASSLISRNQFKGERYVPFNKSGTITPIGPGINITLVKAEHSSSVMVNKKAHYGGEPSGFIMEFEDGKKIYHMGDTGLFGDMKLIGSYYRPDLVLIPIGGTYTMGPKEAAYAIKEMIKPNVVIPMHYHTFPVLSGSPAEFKKHLGRSMSSRVKVLKPGESYNL
jgi:L-ascorbate metabolism protein UlaG (beta-lactamase superfamily)